MQVVILAGGHGSRLSERTDKIPKPLVEIGGYPIILHIIEIYARQGHKEFIIAGGYKVDQFKFYFSQLRDVNNDISINYSNGSLKQLNSHWLQKLGVVVKIIDTGLHTQTGSRLKRLSTYLDDTFMLTYGDGVGNVNLSELKKIHDKNSALITITGVKPKSRYGKLVSEGHKIKSFVEKPKFDGELVNAGYMMISKKFLELIDNENDVLIENEPFKRAIKKEKMYVYEHLGFWHPMDTLRDQRNLDRMTINKPVPWLTD